MARQPDSWDVGKLVCGIGIVAGILSMLAGEKKGGPLLAASVLGEVACGALEPPVCDNCDIRTTYETSIRGFRCPSCLKLFQRFLA